MQALVDASWLAGERGAGDLHVFDASYYLPAEKADPRALYRQAHIPGARFFDIDEVADPSSALPHMAPDAARFAALMDAWGVRRGDRVVFYDQRGLFSAARGWWLLRLFGHERVAVLDGGLPAWRKAGHPVDSGDGPARSLAVPAPGAGYVPTLRPALVRSLDDLRGNLASQRELVLDARSADRFHARVPEPRPGLRGGHIPGSRSLPFGELIGPDGRMLPAAQLRARLAAAGVGADTPIVTSCGSGATATVLLLALAVAGWREGALYDGSWAEWGARADVPIATD